MQADLNIGSSITELARLIADEIGKPRPMRTVTFGKLFTLYLEQHVNVRHKDPDNAHSFYKVYGSCWGGVPVHQITRRDLQEWHDGLAQRSRSAAERAVNMMSAIINWGIRREHLPPISNPASGVEKFKTASRKRFMTPEEFTRFESALDKESPIFRDFFLVCLTTGARRDNVQSMRWDEVDFDLAMWTIPDTKFKNGEEHVIPLSSWALDILKRRRKIVTGSPWVFPSPRRKGKHLVEPKRAWARILKRAGLNDLRIHDLRRTMRSYMAIRGENQYTIAQMLGHKDMRSTAVYARLNLTAVRGAVDRVTERWQDLLALPAPQPVAQIENKRVTRQPNANADLTPSQQIIIEARILTAINKGGTTKTAFYRNVGSINKITLDRVLTSMIDRQIIERYRDDSGVFRYLLAGLDLSK